MAAQALLMTHPGNNRIKFCSSLSSTSNVKYWKLSGNRGLTEKASLASRMQTLDWVKRWWFRAWGILLKSMKSVHMWVILRLCSLSNSFEAWKGPRRRPGRISWHSRLISYLHRPWMNSVSVNVVKWKRIEHIPPLHVPWSLYDLLYFIFTMRCGHLHCVCGINGGYFSAVWRR